MINPSEFTTQLIENKLEPVIEVPCSYLKDFLNYLDKTKRIEVINPVNEALAMGIASGYYLSTGKVPIVAMQNSGLMNTFNALTSLNQIYDIPVFYLITWRGEGGKGFDAPEHEITGEKLEIFLKTFNIQYEILDEKKYKNQINKLSKLVKKSKKPVALIIKKNIFQKISNCSKKSSYEMTRFEALKIIKDIMNRSIFISSTGYPTRDSFNIKDTPDFYMVGSMGHTFAIALGISPHTDKKVIVLDGDGSFLMHLGGFASFNPDKYRNIIYFVLDNESYESTGGQPTVSEKVNILLLAKAFNFRNIYEVLNEKDLKKVLSKLKKIKEAAFIHVKIKNNDEDSVGTRVSDKYTCPQIKERFMKQLDL